MTILWLAVFVAAPPYSESVRGNEDKVTTSADDLCIRSLSMVRETASKSDGNSEPFGSGFAQEG